MPSSLSLMLVILFTLLPPPLVFSLELSLCFIPISILTCKSPLEVVQPSFPLLLYTMLFTLSLLTWWRLLLGWPNTLKYHQLTPSSMYHSSILEESWDKGCNQVQTLFTFCSMLQSTLGFCLCSKWLDYGWLEGGDMVWQDPNQSPGVRWLHIDLEKVRKEA